MPLMRSYWYDSEEMDSRHLSSWMRLLRRLKIVAADWIWRLGSSFGADGVDDNTTWCQPKAANNISTLDELLPLKCVDTEIDICAPPCRVMRPSSGFLCFFHGEVAFAFMTYGADGEPRATIAINFQAIIQSGNSNSARTSRRG